MTSKAFSLEDSVIKDLYGDGFSILQISRLYECDESTIRYRLRTRGVPIRPRGKNNWKGKAAHGWKGGTYLTGNGYISAWVSENDPLQSMRMNNGYVLEHRLVVARHYNRPLSQNETVHHINGDKRDNRIENLQLRSGNHGQGQVHRCEDCGSTNIVCEEL